MIVDKPIGKSNENARDISLYGPISNFKVFGLLTFNHRV
jgi:hypothetical protein